MDPWIHIFYYETYFLYCAVKKVFSEKLRPKTLKNDSKMQKITKFFENVQTLPNASECVRMHPNGSGRIQMGPSTSENFENTAKTLKNLAKTSKIFAKLGKFLPSPEPLPGAVAPRARFGPRGPP